MKESASFDYFIERHRQRDLIVQPRMGFSDWREMRQGLKAVKTLNAPTVGTLTVDALTRQGLVEQARRVVARGDQLNGYPGAGPTTRGPGAGFQCGLFWQNPLIFFANRLCGYRPYGQRLPESSR